MSDATFTFRVDEALKSEFSTAAGTRELVALQNYVLVYDVAGDLVRVLGQTFYFPIGKYRLHIVRM